MTCGGDFKLTSRGFDAAAPGTIILTWLRMVGGRSPLITGLFGSCTKRTTCFGGGGCNVAPDFVFRAGTLVCNDGVPACDADAFFCNAGMLVCDTDTLVCNTGTLVCDADVPVCNADVPICDATTLVCGVGTLVCDVDVLVQRGTADGAACGCPKGGAGLAEPGGDSLGTACSADGTRILCGGLGFLLALNAVAPTTTGNELSFAWLTLLLLLQGTLLFLGPIFGRPTGFLGGEDAGCTLEHVEDPRDFWLGFWEEADFLPAARVLAAARCALATLSTFVMGPTALSSSGALQSTGTLSVEGRRRFLACPSASPEEEEEEAGGGKMEGTASGRSSRILTSWR